MSTDQQKQAAYRDARFLGKYDDAWKSVNKCVFCDLKTKYIVYQENNVVLTISLFAYIDGHLMIVPRRHIKSPKELTSDEWQTIRKMMYIAKKIIKKVHNISGLQIIQKDGASAQSTVANHIHFHCVPFDSPDLLHWNYRQLANTPLENAQIYQKSGLDIAKLASSFEKKYTKNEPTEALDKFDLDWNQLAFANKKPLCNLKATFIVAPRQMSNKRFIQIIKDYLPHSNIILGLAKEDFIDGFDNQPQFKTLQKATIAKLVDKINSSPSKNKIYCLSYFQRDLTFIIEKIKFPQALLINGSWQFAFHLTPTYFALINTQTKFKLLSPFCDEAEAKAFVENTKLRSDFTIKKEYSAAEILQIADQAAKLSYDHTFQTGAVLAQKTDGGYKNLLQAFNKIVPYQSYALHHGSSREQNFSPANDLNHYDANHAEAELLIAAHKQNISLKNTSLFINLMPCPTCARLLCQTDITKIVYRLDHSDGYAAKLLQAAGKKISRLIE